MTDELTKIFVSFEPALQGFAERLDGWTHTNLDKDFYNHRADVPVDSPQAEPFKQVLRQQISEAQVTVCLISQMTSLDPWIAWELETSKSAADRKGLVGVVLREYAKHPPAMADSGAIFVAFKQDLVERAIKWALEEKHASDDFTLQDN